MPVMVEDAEVSGGVDGGGVAVLEVFDVAVDEY